MPVKQFSASERIGPAKVPMDLDVGRLTARDAAELLALALGALAVATVGALLAWLAWPEFGEWSGWRFAFISFGGSIALLGVGLAVITALFAVRDWLAYQNRLADYHGLVVASHATTGGVEVERVVTGWELLTDRPLHAIGIALAVHEKVQKGDPSPFSTRQLEGAQWLGGVRLGDLSAGGAEQTSKLLADVGLIAGRGARQAGRWTAESEQDVIHAVIRGWVKRGRLEDRNAS